MRATALDPLSAGKVTVTAATLEATDRLGEAKDVLRSGVRIWPDDFAVRLYQRYFVLTYGSREEATAVLQDSARLFPLKPSALEALRRFISARAANDPSLRATAARALTDAANAGAIDRRLAISALSALGDTNAAFAQADVLFSDPFAETTSLFVPATASMRRDPRFMALADRVGLVGYWRQSGKWPDFCAGSAAPYDCAAVARGLVR